MRLHFVCCRQHENCIARYGDDTTEFIVETHTWSKWLKLGFTGLKFGVSVVQAGTGNVLGLVKSGKTAAQEVYDQLKSKGDDDYQTQLQKPLLTVKERDKLIEQLRDERFFDHFTYDEDLNGWCCTECKDNPGQSPQMIECERQGLSGYGGSVTTAAATGNAIVKGGIAALAEGTKVVVTNHLGIAETAGSKKCCVII